MIFSKFVKFWLFKFYWLDLTFISRARANGQYKNKIKGELWLRLLHADACSRAPPRLIKIYYLIFTTTYRISAQQYIMVVTGSIYLQLGRTAEKSISNFRPCASHTLWTILSYDVAQGHVRELRLLADTEACAWNCKFGCKRCSLCAQVMRAGRKMLYMSYNCGVECWRRYIYTGMHNTSMCERKKLVRGEGTAVTAEQ